MIVDVVQDETVVNCVALLGTDKLVSVPLRSIHSSGVTTCGGGIFNLVVVDKSLFGLDYGDMEGNACSFGILTELLFTGEDIVWGGVKDGG